MSNKNQAGLGMLLAIVFFAAAMFMTKGAGDNPSGPVVLLALFLILAAAGLFIWGTIAYALSKGYPGVLGLIGLTGLLGLVILLVLPDRQTVAVEQESKGDWSSRGR